MNNNRFAKQVSAAAGFCFLCTAPGLTRPQSSPPSPAQTPQPASPAAQAKKDAHQADVYAGLQFTDDQKTKISQIHHDFKSRMDAVANDEKLDKEQKEAMTDGYRRMENGEIFKVLTPEQQAEVRKRVHALRAAEQQKQKKAMPAPPQPK